MAVLTRAEVLELIANGENSGVEFKRDELTTEALAKELVAFSNLDGGMVLLGVEDDGQVRGLARPELEEWVMSVGRDKIRPPLIPFFEQVREVTPGTDIAVVRVPRGYAVHGVLHHGRTTYYVRVGTQSRELDPDELGRLFQRRSAFRAELRPISGVTFGDLDVRRLSNYLGSVRQQDIPTPADEAAWRTLLINTEIMVEEGVSLAGVLLFAQNPGRFLPFAAIDAAAYPGVEKDYATLERTTIRGPMTPLRGQSGLVENGLVEQAIDFVTRNTSREAVLEGGARVERPAFPPEVVREVLVNALIHRDYLLYGSDIELSVYANRLEVTSPGRLPNGITLERMRTGCRAARNQLLKDIMRDYGYLEHMGMGVPRKIIRGMLEHNGTEPLLTEDGESFRVTIFA